MFGSWYGDEKKNVYRGHHAFPILEPLPTMDDHMALSDREKKILSDIEAALRAEDPKLHKTVSTTTVSSHTRRQVKLAAVGLIVGFLLLLAFIVNIWLGVAGFVVMLASAVHGANMLKRLSDNVNTRLGSQLRGGFDRYMRDRRDRDDHAP